MNPKNKRPNLDQVTTINDDGSRYIIHPADVKGPFTFWRRLVGFVLVSIYILLPWIPIGGNPAVFLDVVNRRFHLFGFTLAAQDLWLLFFLVSGLAFFLYYISALFGRIWCGWACPYTVFLDHVYRRIERLYEGDAARRKKLDNAEWTLQKFFLRASKHLTYVIVSLLIAHIFLAYFISLPRLYSYMHDSPLDHFGAFGVVVFLTCVLYFCFAWFREQFCIIVCPYGRLQSALTDDDTIIIGYDEKRGEPRGKKGDVEGDCVDCKRCIQVCPTGIDIRNGLQLECIGCAACLDACDDIMTKLKRPLGLIRYDSLNGLEGKKRQIVRPRILVYTALMLLGAGLVLGAMTKVTPFEMSIIRLPGMPYMEDAGFVRNQIMVRLLNKKNHAVDYTIKIDGLPESSLLIGTDQVIHVDALKENSFTVAMAVPKADYQSNRKFTIIATEKDSGDHLERSAVFLGPEHTKPVNQ
ncbi:MAG: cytochrome c oxidase accessory protein CcoG [Chthoniobacterales bacterium]